MNTDLKNNGIKDEIYKMVQNYLKPCPVIIWGSGATIPFGMPSMDDLKASLGIQEQGNLEEILSKITDEEKKCEYEQKIYNEINKKDGEFRQQISEDNEGLRPIKKLISYFYESHPQLLNIMTTNYDCVLEYIFADYDLSFSDGYSGREFSSFDESRFKETKHINLYKVHGSLRWYKSKYSYHNSMMDGIFPSKDKYQMAYQEPYRTIIAKSDSSIKNAQCFLCIGFGFNDEHLTPKIEAAIKNGKAIVIVTKNATGSTIRKLENIQNYLLIEKGEKDGTTKFSFIMNTIKHTEILEGNFWKIEEFNQMIGQ